MSISIRPADDTYILSLSRFNISTQELSINHVHISLLRDLRDLVKKYVDALTVNDDRGDSIISSDAYFLAASQTAS